jgi:septum formation protein
MQQVGLEFSLLTAHVDETPLPGELPAAYVERLARAKAEAGLNGVPPGWGLVIAADTTVSVDGEVLGKPGSEAEALAMWRRLSGRSHEVLTGLAVADHERTAVAVVVTTVHFRTIADDEMLAYWACGEPADKAGGYAIQGRGALFVSRIEGSYSNVVGLPLAELGTLLESFDYPLWA